MDIKQGNPNWKYAKCHVCGLWIWGTAGTDPHTCAICGFHGLKPGDVPYQDDGMPVLTFHSEEDV